MSAIRRHLWISGRVQGVFFRHSTNQKARAIGGLRGWVRNLPDGRVEALIEGPEPAVAELVDFCHHGPPTARVEHVEIAEENPQGDLAPFGVTH